MRLINNCFLYSLFGLLLFSGANQTFAGHSFCSKPVHHFSLGTVDEFMPRNGNNIGPGSLVADAMLEQCSYIGAQVAIISSSEIFTDLTPGPLSRNEIRRLVLNTPLISFDLTPSELTMLIEFIHKKRFRPASENIGLHVSGLRFSFDKNAADNHKVNNLENGSLKNGYTKPDTFSTLRIVSTPYIAGALLVIKGKNFLNAITPLKSTLYQALEYYIATLGTIGNSPENRINIAAAQIMVFSDPHYFAPSLLINDGPAFQRYIAQDRKMIAESRAIFLSTVSSIRQKHPDICLIPGDLTKDGELVSHKELNQILQDSLISAGVKVFVAPGNHDINNFEAVAYNGNNTTQVDDVSAEQFTEIYERCGYGDAIAGDTASLSYIAEPMNGLWILSIDACKYRENIMHSVTGGALSSPTLDWITNKLDYARKHNITVIGMMHHGITEHYTGQTQIMMGMFKDYVIDDWMSVRDSLASHGLKVIFSGHYHAQDIVKHAGTSGSFIYDIETGSSVTWPCPIRSIDLSPAKLLNVETSYVDTIDYPLQAVSFQDYAKKYLVNGMTQMIYNLLTLKFGVASEQAQVLAPVVSTAFAAHYAGDEKPGQIDVAAYTQLKMSPDPLTASMGYALEGLWTDLHPADNSCTIDLTSGEAR